MTSAGDRYDGCNVYRFKDLTHGQLERIDAASSSSPKPSAASLKRITALAPRILALKGGILLSQIVSPAAPRIMQIRRSGVELR